MAIYMDYVASADRHGLVQKGEDIEASRKKIANFVGCEVEEIIFTSGGTESNNFMLFGLAKANPNKKHIIVSAIEHVSILEACEALAKEGYKIDYIGVDSEGLVDPRDVEKRITSETLVVSICHADNEVGVIQPIKEISEICKRKNVYVHSDCAQTFRKLDTKVSELGVDLMTVSGHKIGSTKGVGFLYVKLGTRIKPLLYGGSNEFKLRGGCENAPGISSLSHALDSDLKKDEVQKVRDAMIGELKKIEGAKINGSVSHRLYNNINVSFSGIDSEKLVKMLAEEGIHVSTGRAYSHEASHVLSAMNVSEKYIDGGIRISLGRGNTFEEGERVVESIKRNVAALRGEV